MYKNWKGEEREVDIMAVLADGVEQIPVTAK